MEHPTGTDRGTAARLKEQLEQMDETAFDESVFRDYLRELGDTVEPEQPIDVQASLRDFEQKHAVLISQLDRQAQSRKAASRSAHRRRLGYRLLLIAAAVAVLNAMCIAAFGRGLGHYTAKWGAETFGFYRDDFPTSKDGKIIYYPDGSWDDRTNMPDYDHETYTALPENNTSSIEEYAQTLEPAEKSEPLPEYADLPDTDLSNVGLEKSDSAWDDGHMTEWFNIENATLADTLSALGIKTKMAPLWLPYGYEQAYIKMTKDYLLGEDSIFAKYEDHTKHSEMFVMISKVTDSSSGTIEKDDRPVLEYVKENTTWYIMHNLQQINAVALTGNYQVLISAPVAVDEMKEIIDSIY